MMMRLACFLVLILSAMTTVAAERLPKDVSGFIEQREACDHWRGEYGYDEERQAEIDTAVCETCVGTDERLAKLKQKYRGKKEIISKLDAFEPDIEPEDTSQTTAFCKRVSSQHDRKH
jgi:predicted metal-dependent hydrolase